MELQLSERNSTLYSKLYISSIDIRYSRECARHLLHKKLFRPPWNRGQLYFHQSAYVTSLVVSYARPFTQTRGSYSFPKKLLRFDKADDDLHQEIINLRNTVYAHSDLASYSIRPWKSRGFSTTIVGQPQLLIEQAKVERFLAMTEPLLERIKQRMCQILDDHHTE